MYEKTKITTNIDSNLYKLIKEIAKKEGRHVNYYIEKGLEHMRKEYEKELKIHEKRKE